MDKVGKLELIETRSFIIPPGDDIWFDVVLKGWVTRLNIRFEPEATKQEIRIEPRSDHGCLTFAKWGSNLGMATKEPLQLANHSSGQKVYFLATMFLIGNVPSESVAKFDIQFLMGELN